MNIYENRWSGHPHPFESRGLVPSFSHRTYKSCMTVPIYTSKLASCHRPPGAISCCPLVPSTSPRPSKTTLIASPKIPKPSSISSSEITSGGTNRNVFVPQVIINSPLSLAAVTIGFGSRVSCIPSIKPLPLISLICDGKRSFSFANPARKRRSLARTPAWRSDEERRETM